MPSSGGSPGITSHVRLHASSGLVVWQAFSSNNSSLCQSTRDKARSPDPHFVEIFGKGEFITKLNLIVIQVIDTLTGFLSFDLKYSYFLL